MNNYIIKSLVSLTLIFLIFVARDKLLSLIGESIIVPIFILCWVLFIGYTIAFIVSWYKKDLAKRAKEELNKEDKSDEESQTGDSRFIPLFR